MCGLYGFLDYGNKDSKVNKIALIKALAWQAQARGTHATGISYNALGKHIIQKAAVPAAKFVYNFPPNAKAIMGHTRHTTQGSEKFNENNHPFSGETKKLGSFSLAHNGMLDNDYALSEDEELPKTTILTDSYVAVQLIEKYDNIKDMAERVSGMFTFTILAENGDLHIVKNDSPMYFVDIPTIGMCVYGSTEAIVTTALESINMGRLKREVIKMSEGEIWTITAKGVMTMQTYKVNEAWYLKQYSRQSSFGNQNTRLDYYEDDLRWQCLDAGIYDNEFDLLTSQFHLGDIEDAIDSGTLFNLLVESYRYKDRVKNRIPSISDLHLKESKANKEVATT